MQQRDCPACGQPNDPEMAFCIFCGGAMSPGGNGSAQVNMPPAVQVFVCQSCGQSDSLNSQFCIFCGARTQVAEVRPLSGTHMSEASPPAPTALGQTSYHKGIGKGATGLSVIAAICGLSLGAAAAYFMPQPAHTEAQTEAPLPKNSLTVFTTKPNSVVVAKWAKKPHYIIGLTGPGKACVFDNMDPDQQYQVSVMNPKTNQPGQKYDAELKGSDSAVLGYPDPLPSE